MITAVLWLFVWLAIIGFAAWLVDTQVPMPATMRTVFRFVAVLVMLLVLIWWLGGGRALYGR